MSASGVVRVSAPARLHFGMLDPAGLGTRRFGGFGVGVSRPRVLLELSPRADGALHIRGPQSDRARRFAERSRERTGLLGGFDVSVVEAIPPHMGLGSGTKLGLAVACGVAALAGNASPGIAELAVLSGRGARSSVGCWTFAAPGLVVEAGVREGEELSPLVQRVPVPEEWRCVLALPVAEAGLSGDAEERFFAELAARDRAAEPSVSRMVLGDLLPGLLRSEIDEFGAALSAIQREVGGLFAAEQGGVFHPAAAPLVAALAELGVAGVGQSSWGPAVYGIVPNPADGARVAEELAATADARTEVTLVDFDRRGGECTLAESVG